MFQLLQLAPNLTADSIGSVRRANSAIITLEIADPEDWPEWHLELHAQQKPKDDPVATAAGTADDANGTVEFALSSAQLNQDLDDKASKKFWLVIYSLDADDEKRTWLAGWLTIEEDNASLTAAPPPDPPVLATREWVTANFSPL